jgi:hypothetical protein
MKKITFPYLSITLYITGCLIFQTSCNIPTGLHTPSFDGVQTVYEKGQSIHSLTTGPSIGKYYNYSPLKNLGLFADVRANNWMPQASVAIGGYSANYTTKASLTRHQIMEKYQYGFHFDSYLGFGFVQGFEQLVESQLTGFFTPNIKVSELTYNSFRTYGQVGGHFKSRSVKLDAVYRLNYYDIDRLLFKPKSETFFPYVEEVAKNNPHILNELQFLVSLGSSDLKVVIGLNVILKGKSANIFNYSKFNSGQIGCTYIFDNFDRY